MIEELSDGELLSKSSKQPKIWRSELHGKPIIEFEAWVSTEAIDRDGEILRMDGWRKPSLQKPKFLLFHDSWELPIGMPYWTRTKEEDGIRGVYSRGRFGPQLHGLAVGELYEQGDMDSFSVGFRWFKRIFDDQADGVKKPFYEYIDQELYEYSAVNIPANSEAIIAMQKMITDAGDIKDVKSIIKGFMNNEQTQQSQRDSYIIKSVYNKDISDLNYKITILESKLEHNASTFEGNIIELDEFDLDDEVNVDDALEIEGDTETEVLVDLGDDAVVEVEVEINAGDD